MEKAIYAPLMVSDEAFGLLTVIGAGLTESDVPAITAFANQAAIAIENARLYESLSQQREELRALAARLAAVEETERQRLVRELHDQVGQNLTALGINLNIVQAQSQGEATDLVRSRLADSLALVEQTTARIRSLMADLRPPVLDDYGLVAALRWLGEQTASRVTIAVKVCGEELRPRLADAVETALFRIAQEALTNVVKHARATQATVTIKEDDGLVRMAIQDDGIGFDPAQPPGAGEHWGLLTMRERADTAGGSCHIVSRPGQGTQVIVEVQR
jgi:two-component system sensor histidine kinase UhpB